MKGSGDIFWHKKPNVESLLNHNFEHFKDDAFLGVNEFVGILDLTFPVVLYIYIYIYKTSECGLTLTAKYFLEYECISK